MSNWVVGYPVQTDREIDLMYEAESAKIWEDQNSHDELWSKALEAVGYLNVVEEHMNKGLDSLVWAKEEINDTHIEYKVGSLIERYEELLCDIRSTIKQFTGGDF